ncbi:MAG: hypothetical protein IPP63_09315 [Chloracidobacterium sp.]|nr:hypothetical protein [Chloracidobacterium sp.]
MENGYQTALMAPTEILAEQHFRNAVKLFADTGYRVELLVGSTRAAQSERSRGSRRRRHRLGHRHARDHSGRGQF